MKYLQLLCFLFLFTVCKAQPAKTLIQQKLIEDISDTPIYPRLTEEKNGQIDWKEHYAYMDSIDLYGITYLSDGLQVKGFVVRPKKQGNYPCIIYNRGGNRDFGALTIGRVAILLGALAKEGYIVVASQYRGNAGGEGLEEFGGKDVNDVLNLLPVLEELPDANTSKIGMYGWSRGGMMTYIALTKTNRIKAAAVGGAPTDKTVIDRPNMETKVYAELIPNYWENKEAELKKRSAYFFADKFNKKVPILILHGNADWRVKSTHSLKLAMELDKYRVPYRLKIFEGADHGIKEFRSEVNTEVLNWFNRFLKEGAALPNMEFHGR